MTSSEKIAHWQKHIDAWRAGPLSQRDYCQQNGLSFSSFGYWRNRLNKTESKKGNLVPVSVQRTTSASVYLPSGVRIDIPVQSLAEFIPLLSAHQ